MHPLSTGPEQVYFDENGVINTYGYFEAWTQMSDAQYFFVLDLSTYTQSQWNTYDLVGLSWVPSTTDIPSYTVSFAVGEHNDSELFVINCDDGSAYTVQAGLMEFPDGTWGAGCSCSVIAGKYYWISKGAITSQAWRMEFEGAFRDVANVFPLTPTNTTISLRISGALNPWGFTVRTEADQSIHELSVAEWENSTSAYNPNTGQWDTVAYYDALVTGDFSASFTVFDAGGTNQGAAFDFFDFGGGPSLPGFSVISAVPATRLGHNMVTTEGFPAYLDGSVITPVTVNDAFFGTPFTYDTAILTAPYTDSAAVSYSLTVTDLVEGDTSLGVDPGWLADTPLLWQAWHPRQPLLLKISATRWRNQLQIRCADGVIHPVTPHRLQGDLSVDPILNTVWFNPYGFFDATTFRQTGIPWHLYDATRNVYLTADGADENSFVNATDNTDTDGDGLKDWYEDLLRTKYNVTDTDGDGQSDFQEVTNGTNPLAKPATASNSTLKVFTPLE